MNECICPTCIKACRNKPGWFAPGEAEKAAKLLDLTFQEFFQQYLCIDYYIRYDGINNIFLLTPAIKDKRCQPGLESPADPRGECIF